MIDKKTAQMRGFFLPATTASLSQSGDFNQATLTQIGVAQSIGAQQIGVENQLSATITQQ
ncbi:MAG: hypothetical protein C0463_04515 [Idiomarina sp.]|nr:hypothetical protein [Idiomarina sp.]